MPDLFDHRLRALRRDRAARIGIESFLYDRAFEDCLARLADVNRAFERVLIAGCPNPEWIARMQPRTITVIDPGELMARAAGGQIADLETMPFGPDEFDLVVSVGVLDTANHLPLAAAALELILKPGGLLLGAIAGGHSLPRLRRAMLAASLKSGQAAAHVHPRIEAPALANLLSSAGFVEPVVDVDRVDLSYGSLDKLVADLRGMAGTNVLTERPRRPLTRQVLHAARRAFLDGQARVIEQVEILHFAAWKAQRP